MNLSKNLDKINLWKVWKWAGRTMNKFKNQTKRIVSVEFSDYWATNTKRNWQDCTEKFTTNPKNASSVSLNIQHLQTRYSIVTVTNIYPLRMLSSLSNNVSLVCTARLSTSYWLCIDRRQTTAMLHRMGFCCSFFLFKSSIFVTRFEPSPIYQRWIEVDHRLQSSRLKFIVLKNLF